MMYANQNINATFATANPKIFTVTNLNDSGPGSLREAILDANANAGDDTIVFADGLSGTITLTSGQLDITDSVVLNGPGANVLAISGNDTSRIFEIDPGTIGTVAINGLTIKEGNGVSGNGNPVSGVGGGAVIIDSGTVTINNCTLSNNSAGIDSGGGGGGGIRKFGPGKLTISNSTVSNNSAFDEFRQGAGGGIRNDQETLTIINSTVSGNSGASGGGIAFDDGRLVISNSTVTGNSADLGGGGIFTGGGELVLGNSIVAGNQAPTDKEIQNFGSTISQGHNLFGENGASGVTEGITRAANDLILSGDITTAIGPLAANGGQTQTHFPVDGGPANDTGDNNLILQGVTTDQRGIGFLRIMDASVDIGAVELSDDVPSPLRIQTPNGGEVWNEGSKKTIRWISDHIEVKQPLQLYLSTDNGLSWKIIASATNVGFKNWSIPKKRYVSKQVMLKICLKQPKNPTPPCDVSDDFFSINQAPVAEAGVKQTVITGTQVTLNGGVSHDPDNGPAALAYKWIKTSGPIVTLTGADTVTPSFIPSVKGTYVFGLVVNDGSANSKQDKVTVKVNPPRLN